MGGGSGRTRAGDRECGGRWNWGGAWTPGLRAQTRVFLRQLTPASLPFKLVTEKLRPREGPRYASGRRGQVWRSRRYHCSEPLTARLPRPAPRTRRARALSWHLVSVCLSTRLPPHGDSWTGGGGAEREKRGRRPPSKAAQVPGCWSLSRQAGAGALEYLISRQVEDEVAAAISGQPLGLRVRCSCSRNSRRGVGAARL